MPLLDNEKAVRLTEAVFNKYMRDKMQDKYQDFAVWQKNSRTTMSCLCKTIMASGSIGPHTIKTI